LEQIRQGVSSPGPGGPSSSPIVHPAANGNFAGLHGQVDPNATFSPLPVQMQQPQATRDPNLVQQVQQSQQQQTMGAFSTDPGFDAMGSQGGGGAGPIQLSQTGAGGIGGASQFTPL